MKKRSKAKRKMAYKVAATVTVHLASEMTPKGRRQIASWLRKQAASLLRHGKDYSARFTGRYYYRTSKAW